MQTAAQTHRKRSNTRLASAQPLFPSGTSKLQLLSGYKPVRKVEEERKQIIQQNNKLAAITECFEKFLKEKIEPDYLPALHFEKAMRAVACLQYSASDVAEFSLTLSRFEDMKGFARRAGFFLSALINLGREKEYAIRTSHLNTLIHNLGYENNGKSITIYGSVGSIAGSHMHSGSLTIYGNTLNQAGFEMRSGIITIYGNAGEHVGNQMYIGIIIVHGDAGRHAGEDAFLPLILIDGKISIHSHPLVLLTNLLRRPFLKLRKLPPLSSQQI